MLSIIHAKKECEACLEMFTPPSRLTADQARQSRCCSTACSAVLARGQKRFRSQVSGMMANSGNCVCQDCQRIRLEDRTDVIARYAAARGLGVTSGPRERRTPEQMSRIAERARESRRWYDETHSDMVRG